MPQFAEILRSYQSGSVSRQQLLTEIDRMLAATPGIARTLLTYVAAEQKSNRLSATINVEISQHIRAWLEDRTIVSSVASRDDTIDLVDQDQSEPTRIPAATDNSVDDDAVGVGDVLLQRFRLIEQIGEGGMSRVYKAIDLRRVEADAADPFVAVKLLAMRFTDHFQSSAVLHREAHKLQTLTHPNIVRVIDCDRDGQTVFMTMEYLAGESLKARLDYGTPLRFEAIEAVRIIEQVAGALEFAHRNGIVHGDLKPGNIFLTTQGEIKVIDFGIARFVSRSASSHEDRLESEAISALTPAYASPEMLEGSRPDARDDVYALGCIAYELLTGVHPFNRLAANVAHDRKLAVARHGVLTNAQFTAISAALAFDRARRTSSAREFYESFRGPVAATRRPYGIYLLVALAALIAGYLLNSRVIHRGTTGVADTAVQASRLSPGSVFRDCPTCPLMVIMPAGQFTQGTTAQSAETTAFEQPAHAVRIGYQLALGEHEVTVGEFREYTGATAQRITGCSVYDGEWKQRSDISWDTLEAQTALHPVSCVSWDDATGYVTWLAKKTRRQYRLASASEWEYAANAGIGLARLNARDVCSIANVADTDAAHAYPGWKVHDCNDGFAQAAPVGSFSANGFGLHDMLGNVFEWVEDCWHDDYQGAPADGSAWAQGDCSQHEMRGGSWFTTPGFVRPAYRNRFPGNYRSVTIGFRVARVIKDEP